MKTYTNRIIGLLVLFLMVSCALESNFGLPNDEEINPELIGEWLSNVKNNDEGITVQKDGEKTYKLLIKDTGNTNTLISYSKTIKGFNIMNIKTKNEGKITNVFYGFKVKGNTLTFSEVTDKLRNKDFESESDLLSFFEENVDKEGFFINQTELKRK